RTAACVAAASVLAKVTRDRLMVNLHELYPDYDFAPHKGYITPGHTGALDRRGPCPEHRRGFITVSSRLLTGPGRDIVEALMDEAMLEGDVLDGSISGGDWA
ncbi:MAG: ribonuclease HII, partial [Geodermatophilaceae bacterium]|nr:ribonuclease HII [Geodermatophilaceae bacterium]